MKDLRPTVRNILILDNQDSFSYNLKHLLAANGRNRVDVVPTDDYHLEMLERYDALVLSPGPSLPDDHKKLKEAIRDAVGVLPILGVCLGHQAIAEFYGGSLVQLSCVMHGIKSEIQIVDHDGLWRDIEQAKPVGRYHSWVVDQEDFPEVLVITSKDNEERIMSFRHRSLPIFGVQFHPESYMSNQGDELTKNFLAYLDQALASRIL